MATSSEAISPRSHKVRNQERTVNHSQECVKHIKSLEVTEATEATETTTAKKKQENADVKNRTRKDNKLKKNQKPKNQEETNKSQEAKGETAKNTPPLSKHAKAIQGMS